MRLKFRGVELSGTSGQPLVVTGFDPGAAAVRANDSDRPNRDGVMVGRDFLGAKVWALDVSVRGRSADEVLATEAPLAAVWQDPAIRLKPAVTVPLSYEMAGRWRRVYGRPGNYAGTNGDYMVESGRGYVTCDFRVTDPLHYDDAEQSVTLTIVPASTGGLMAPLVAPLSTVRSSAPRAGFVTNTGDASTPLKVTFKGPVTDPWVRSPSGWEVGVTGSLAYDQSITIDPLSGTVKLQNGAAANGRLTRKTRLSGTLLKPGTTELTFGGTDLTGTATATLSWRNAHTSI